MMDGTFSPSLYMTGEINMMKIYSVIDWDDSHIHEVYDGVRYLVSEERSELGHDLLGQLLTTWNV